MNRLTGRLVLTGILIALVLAFSQHFYRNLTLAFVLGGLFLVYVVWPRRRCGVCGSNLDRFNEARNAWWLHGSRVTVCTVCDMKLVKERSGNTKTPSHG